MLLEFLLSVLYLVNLKVGLKFSKFRFFLVRFQVSPDYHVFILSKNGKKAKYS